MECHVVRRWVCLASHNRLHSLRKREPAIETAQAVTGGKTHTLQSASRIKMMEDILRGPDLDLWMPLGSLQQLVAANQYT